VGFFIPKLMSCLAAYSTKRCMIESTMPIYQYKCTDCGHQLEALQKMSDPRLTHCPECQKPSLRKQLTAAAFKLKGSGWYETDFKNSGVKPAATKSSEDSKPKDSTAGTVANDSSSDSKSSDSKSAESKSSESKSPSTSAKPTSAAAES
jgi:putative FmdB family regulatory protein